MITAETCEFEYLDHTRCAAAPRAFLRPADSNGDPADIIAMCLEHAHEMEAEGFIIVELIEEGGAQ